MEILQLANSRFSVVPEGEVADPGAEGEFETRQEAEEWLFRRSQEIARDTDAGILTPGGGQGVR